MLLDIHSNELEQLLQQGNDCVEQKKQQQALLYFIKAVLLAPEHTLALVCCAETLLDLNRTREAAIYAQRALELSPSCNILTLNAKALFQIGEYSAALDCFERVIAEEPNNYMALGQRALCLTQLNRHEEAFHVYQQALALSAHQDPWIHYNYSLCLLALGKLLAGFTAYEYRWLAPLRLKNRSWVLPESGCIEELKGKSILIHSEQGLGDSIHFFRYIPLLVQAGAHVFLEIQPILIPLFYAWRHTIHFIAIASPLPRCDYHCPLMSLARLFKTEIDNIPTSIPYIFPEIATVESCQKKLGYSSNKRVGIAWRGSSLNTMNPQRSIALEAFLTVHQPDLDFICLQKEIYLEEKKELDAYKIDYHSLELSTMLGTAALIACLDLVITVDTSIAHLAAAMGKDVWILLPLNADWRWFLHREDSPWYPTVRLFRQATLGDWSFPLSCIKKSLTSFQPIVLEASLDELIHQADRQLQKGLLLQAEQLYHRILIKNPGCHSAFLGSALVAFQHHKMADAIKFMQQAVELAPNLPLYRRNLGELLRRVGQWEAAIAAHKIAISIEPHSAENHFLLGLAYNNHHQFALSIQHYRIALSYDQHHGFAWNNLGASLECIGDKEEAKRAYCAAIRLNPKHAEAHNNLAAIYSEDGLLEEARTHFEAAILANPEFVDAHYNLSVIKKYTKKDPHLSFIESIMPKLGNCSISTRIRYYFTLGKALDDVQEYTRAFKAYEEGNRLHYQQNPWNKTKLQDIVAHIPKIFTPSFLKQAPQSKDSRCPIFIVGMPRSGTTLIEQILASHKDIYGAGELSILDDLIQKARQATDLPFHEWVALLSSQDFIRLGEQYLKETWALAEDKHYIVDKMPSNSFYIGMIYRMLPTAKIIHAIRDPMDSCFSCFTHLFKNGMSFAYDLSALGNYYTLYAHVMQHWRLVLPRKAIFDVPYEEMVHHPEDLSKQIIEYIGLPWDPNCLQFYKNKRVVKTASLTQVRQPIYKTSMQRWQHFSDALQPLLDIVAPLRDIKGISR